MRDRQTIVPADSYADQRRHMRRLTLKTATISDEGRALDCAVLNISASGACLLVADADLVPEAFELRIDGIPGRRPARRVWTNAHRVGVHFLAPARPADSSTL